MIAPFCKLLKRCSKIIESLISSLAFALLKQVCFIPLSSKAPEFRGCVFKYSFLICQFTKNRYLSLASISTQYSAT